jgi:hypothetical protein
MGRGPRPARNTADLLPPIPRVFFVYVEPVIILSGIIRTHASRLPLLAALPTPPIPFETLLAPGASAAYLFLVLLYGLVVLLVAPPSRALAQAHVLVLVAADLALWTAVFSLAAETHPGGLPGVLADRAAWSEDMRMMVFGPLLTFAVKVATLAEVFGSIRVQ